MAGSREGGAASSGVRSRLPWFVVVQLAASGRSVLLTIGAARALDAEDFGRFSLIVSVLMLATGALRQTICDGLLLTRPVSTSRQDRNVVAWSLSAALLSTVVVALALGGIAVLIGAPAAVLILLGLAVPAAIQEVARAMLAARNRLETVLLADTLWALLLVASLFAADAAPSGITIVACAWAAGLGLALLITAGSAALPWRALLEFRSRSWSSLPERFRRMVGNSLANIGVVTVIVGVTPWFVALVVSVQAAGALTATRQLFGLVQSAVTGVSQQGLGRLGAPGASARRVLESQMRRVLAVGGVFALLAVALIERFGSVLLGDTWPLAQEIVWLMSLGAVAIALAAAPIDAIRAHATIGWLLASRVLLAVLVLASTLLGAAAGGLRGAAIGEVAGLAAAGVTWLVIARVRLPRER